MAAVSFDDLVPGGGTTGGPVSFDDLIPKAKPTLMDRVVNVADQAGQVAQGFVTKHGRDLATVAGGTIGGIIAAPPAAATAVPTLGVGSVATEMGGVGLGAAIGGQIYDRAQDYVAGRRTPLSQQIGTAAQDVTANALAVPAGQVIGRGVSMAAPAAGRVAAQVFGRTSGAGARAVEDAARAGYKGGQAQNVFRSNISGDVPIEDVVNATQAKLSSAYGERGAAYRSGIAPISADTQQIAFDDIHQALADTADRGTYKGKIVNADAQKAWKAISAKVTDWEKSGLVAPGDLDALKKAVGGIRDNYQPGTPAFNVADTIYKKVNDTITQASPDYARVMQDYASASQALDDIRKGLSLGKNASTPTKAGKLLSAMKANTGPATARSDQLNALIGPNDTQIAPALAGQALRQVMPGGLGGAVIGAGELVSLALHSTPAAMKVAAAAAGTSPRIVGEAANRLGQISGAIGTLSKQMGKSPAARAAIASYLASIFGNNSPPAPAQPVAPPSNPLAR